MKGQVVNLANIGDGAAVELFEAELEKVLENIADPNTPADAVREITLKLKMKPDASRQVGAVGIQATSKLAPFNGAATTLFFTRNKEGGRTALMQDPAQPGLFSDDDETPEGAKTGGLRAVDEGGK